MTSSAIIAALEAAGFVWVRTNGSHCQFAKEGHPWVVTVPHPRKDMPIGTVKNIERASGVKLT